MAFWGNSAMVTRHRTSFMMHHIATHEEKPSQVPALAAAAIAVWARVSSQLLLGMLCWSPYINLARSPPAAAFGQPECFPVFLVWLDEYLRSASFAMP